MWSRSRQQLRRVFPALPTITSGCATKVACASGRHEDVVDAGSTREVWPCGTHGDRANRGRIHRTLPQVWDYRAGAGIVRRSATVAAGAGTEESPQVVPRGRLAPSHLLRISRSVRERPRPSHTSPKPSESSRRGRFRPRSVSYLLEAARQLDPSRCLPSRASRTRC